MAVLIVDMALPEMCEECKLEHTSENYYGDIMERHCPVTGESTANYGWCRKRERRPDCPLIEINIPNKADEKLLEDCQFEL